jgi:di/tripeptidase
MIEKFITMKEEEIFNLFNETFKNCVYKKNNYLYIKGVLTNVLFNAHVDTVKSGRNFNLKRYGDVIYNSLGILGADDRAGVYILYELAKAGGSILLTNFEESTGMGVKTFCKDFKELNHNLFVGLDRKGFKEFVSYTYSNNAIDSIFKKLGYEKKMGSHSDVRTLTENFSRYNVNLSAGFYNEHTTGEYLSLSSMKFVSIPSFGSFISIIYLF